jgi:hypothetical protein
MGKGKVGVKRVSPQAGGLRHLVQLFQIAVSIHHHVTPLSIWLWVGL